ncbi:MAG: hypothetical protein JXB39_03105 [Deltaproteobacteria bacterium]|nr:hypothetical protein [Deltaproteobacteria bacterium]
MNPWSRRRFLARSSVASLGVAALPFWGCALRRPGVLDVPIDGYPTLEVSGSHGEIGRVIGTTMRERILGHLEVSPAFRNGVAFVEGAGRRTIERMLAHSRSAFPHLVEEIEGMADGLEIPFLHLFAHQCRSEIEGLRDPPGCSTIAIRHGQTAILAHNEDGSDLDVGRMFLARVTPPSGVTFLALVYPGLIPGNGPGLNRHGIVETTNFIQPHEVADGIPRYLIGRAILEARTLDEAVRLATTGPRAFPWHHNLLSLEEGRILSIETVAWPEPRADVLEIEGLQIHTNHLLHPALVGDTVGKRPYDVPYVSSTTRLDVLTRAVAKWGPPSNVAGVLDLLSLHEGRPYSPCRHPRGRVRGATLATAIFQAPEKRMVLFHGNPCLGNRKEHRV